MATQDAPKDVSILVAQLNYDDPTVRTKAQNALVSMGEHSIQSLLDSFGPEHVGFQIWNRNARARMAAATPPPPPPLKLWQSELPPYPIQAETLVRIGGRAIPSLCKAVVALENPERYAVLDVLFNIGEPAIAPLVAILEGDASIKVRCSVTECLGQFKSKARNFQPRVLSILKQSDESEVQIALIEALAEIDPTEPMFFSILERLAQRAPHNEVRAAAKKTMERLK